MRQLMILCITSFDPSLFFSKDNKADVILKYSADEARSLKAYGELPEYAELSETDTFDPEDDETQFKDPAVEDEDTEVSELNWEVWG